MSQDHSSERGVTSLAGDGLDTRRGLDLLPSALWVAIVRQGGPHADTPGHGRARFCRWQIQFGGSLCKGPRPGAH